MNNKTITADVYFLKQHKLCTKLLIAFTNKKDEEDLHRLRVAIKKIKAILLMLNHLQNNFNFRENYAPYKNLFKLLGPMREEILHVTRLNEDAGTIKAKISVAPILDGFNKELKLSAPGYLRSMEDASLTIAKYLQQLNRKKIYPYCKKLLKQLKSKWEKVNTDKKLHKYRQHLKQLLYCKNLLTLQEKNKLLSPKEYKLLEKLQHLIGAWHDTALLLAKIEEKHLEVSPGFVRKLQNETKEIKKSIHLIAGKLW